MNRQPFRLPTGGRIDRSRTLRVSFDGQRYDAHPGDSLSAALLAGGRHLIARSFKYHRPRGILAAGMEDPNALVQLETRPELSEPNKRAGQVEVYDGLAARSQNRWPGLAFDVGAWVDRIAPLFPAGFYYKTFKWPAGAWMTYERIIRKSAGQGRAPSGPDPEWYDHTHAHCDVLVAGGGPAGLAAALAAARAGARVILADEQSEPGGSLLDEPVDGRRIEGRPAGVWLAETLAELAAMDTVRVLSRTTVAAYYDHDYLVLLERVSDHLAPAERPAERPRQRLWKVRARRVVLATGAVERPLVFPDNDRPGILLAGAVRTYLHRYAVAPGRRVALFTNNDSAYRTALDLLAAGVAVAGVVDIRPAPDGALPTQVRDAGVAIMAGSTVVATGGRRRLDGLEVMRLSADGRSVEPGLAVSLGCDALAVSGGWNPLISLHAQARGRPVFDAATGAFLPGPPVWSERSVGACRGSFTLGGALAEGLVAGADAARLAGHTALRPTKPPIVAEAAETPPRILWRLPGRAGKPGRAFVDYQSDVTDKDLKLALREGYRSIEHVKRYTTAGMGTDQGKIGNVNVLGIVADALGVSVPEVGVTAFRPPYTPITFGAIAGRGPGRFLDPIRTTPMHAWHEAAGAVFENVGQWKRPWYYRRSGESMRQSVDREVAAARAGAGLLDATTLGKIDVRGPDAGVFLDRIYTNAFSTLKVGRARYGLMLGEDGMVMDDGVTARLADDHFHMTTTTGGAAAVLNWLESWLQTEWPDLKVYLTSATEQWAVMSLCGPLSRQILAPLAQGIDFDGEAFPFMSFRDGTVAGVPARVFRISFTGELSYEVNVPAGHGLAVWEALMSAGRPHGITPYGTEAMHVLRAEKGFIIVGQETDGTVTPLDLAMDWIVSKKKDFIGRRSLARSDTARADRKQLVGLLTDEPSLVLEEGAQLIDQATVPPPPVPMRGHVTSSYHSPNLGRSIALALVERGRDRMGERIYAALADRTVAATIVNPVFYDPEGKRQNG